MLRPDPAQRPRVEGIIANLDARLAEARERAWLGEAVGIEVSIAAAQAKLVTMRRLVSLSILTIRTNGVTA